MLPSPFLTATPVRCRPSDLSSLPSPETDKLLSLALGLASPPQRRSLTLTELPLSVLTRVIKLLPMRSLLRLASCNKALFCTGSLPLFWRSCTLDAEQGRLTDSALLVAVGRSRSIRGEYELESLSIAGQPSISFDAVTSIVTACGLLESLDLTSAGPQPLSSAALDTLASARAAAVGWLPAPRLRLRCSLQLNSDEDASALTMLLRRCGARQPASLLLEGLDISWTCVRIGGDRPSSISRAALEALARALSGSPGASLRSLDVAGLLPPGGALAAALVRPCTGLSTLNLSRNVLGGNPDRLQPLCAALVRLPHLTSLMLVECALRPPAAAALVMALPAALEALELRLNPLLFECGRGDAEDGTSVLAEGPLPAALAHALGGEALPLLTRLDVAGCGLGLSGAAALEAALQSQTPLKFLCLAHNPLGSAGAAVLAPGLGRLRLTSLQLNETGLGQDLLTPGSPFDAFGASALAAALANLRTLQSIDLCHNPVDSAGETALRAMAEPVVSRRGVTAAAAGSSLVPFGSGHRGTRMRSLD